MTKHKYSAQFTQSTCNEKHKKSKRPTKLITERDKVFSQAVTEKPSLEVIHQEIKDVVYLRAL